MRGFVLITSTAGTTRQVHSGTSSSVHLFISLTKEKTGRERDEPRAEMWSRKEGKAPVEEMEGMMEEYEMFAVRESVGGYSGGGGMLCK